MLMIETKKMQELNNEYYDKENFTETVTFESFREKISQFAHEREWDQFHTPRNLVLALTGEIGEISELFQWRGDSETTINSWSQSDKIHLGEEISDVFIYLVRLADQCNIDLPLAAFNKMKKNALKYPPKPIESPSSIEEEEKKYIDAESFQADSTLELLRKKLEVFAQERKWSYTPRDITFGLIGEVGELTECFQWKPNTKAKLESWTTKEKIHLGEELSDVLIYLVILSDKCDIDLPAAALTKMQKNSLKYPAELVKGSSKKYNEYKKRKI